METFRDMGEEAIFFRRQQITKYTHVYSISLQIPTPLTAGQVINMQPVLQIMEDADFHVTHMSGSVTDPVISTGVRYQTTHGSDLTLLFPMAGSPNRGMSGIWFKFEDPKANRPLQSGIPNQDDIIRRAQGLVPYDNTMLPFEAVFTPGYAYSWGKPIKFDYTLMKNTRLKILLQNRQHVTSEDERVVYTRVSMAFIGHRYEN